MDAHIIVRRLKCKEIALCDTQTCYST